MSVNPLIREVLAEHGQVVAVEGFVHGCLSNAARWKNKNPRWGLTSAGEWGRMNSLEMGQTP
jgi:hypothetical protein